LLTLGNWDLFGSWNLVLGISLGGLLDCPHAATVGGEPRDPMSLFADSRYQWRETYFVLFDHKHRPRAADVKRLLAELGPRIEIHELAESDGGHLDSMTVLSHADAAGMDISYGEGEEVKEQVLQLRQEWKSKQPDAKEKPHIARALHADARF